MTFFIIIFRARKSNNNNANNKQQQRQLLLGQPRGLAGTQAAHELCVKVLPCCGCVWAESQKKGRDIKKEEKKKMHRMWACVEATDCLKMKGLFKGRKYIEEVSLNNICNFHR